MSEPAPRSWKGSIGRAAVIVFLLVAGAITAVGWNSRRHEYLHPGGYRLLLVYRDLRPENLSQMIKAEDRDWLAKETGSRRLANATAWRTFLASQPQQDCLLGLWDFQDHPIVSGRFHLTSQDGQSVVAWEEIGLPSFEAATGVDLKAKWESSGYQNMDGSASYGGAVMKGFSMVDLGASRGLTTFDKFYRFALAGDELNFGEGYQSGWYSFWSDKLIAVSFEDDHKFVGPWHVFEIGLVDEVQRTARLVQYPTTAALLRWINERYDATDLDERLGPSK